MPQSLSQVLVHMVYSTKHRQPTLTKEIREQLYPYIGGVLKNHGCTPLQMGGVEDHVHLLFGLSRTMAIAQVAEKTKTTSARWIKSKWDVDFSWQAGYGVFSVGMEEVEAVRGYILNQEVHHRQVSFQDEFRTLLRVAGIAFDERYMWD